MEKLVQLLISKWAKIGLWEIDEKILGFWRRKKTNRKKCRQVVKSDETDNNER